MHCNFVVLVLAVLACVVVTAASSSDVIDLDPNSFKKVVLESEAPILVEFFAPWCGHCKRLAPEWEKAATNLKGIYPLAKVDCTVHQNLCQQYQVQGYPTIKVFSEKGKKIRDYQQERQAGAIVRFATDDLPNNVVRIKDATSLASFLDKNSEIPKLMLFTSKSEVSPLMKSLALSFKGRVAFGQVKQDATTVLEKYSIDTFPSIIVVTDQNETPTKYEGKINPEELRAFVTQFAGEDSDSAAAAPPPPPAPRVRPPKQATDVSYVEVTVDNLETACPGLCVLGFVDTETVEDKRVVQSEDQSLLDAVLTKFKVDGKLTFGWIDRKREESTGLIEKFSITEKTILVFNGKRQRYVKSSTFDVNSAIVTIEHVLTGDAQYVSVSI